LIIVPPCRVVDRNLWHGWLSAPGAEFKWCSANRVGKPTHAEDMPIELSVATTMN